MRSEWTRVINIHASLCGCTSHCKHEWMSILFLIFFSFPFQFWHGYMNENETLSRTRVKSFIKYEQIFMSFEINYILWVRKFFRLHLLTCYLKLFWVSYFVPFYNFSALRLGLETFTNVEYCSTFARYKLNYCYWIIQFT